MPWVDNFINLSIKLENQCNDSREKAYHTLMRELFSMKAFRDASSQDGLVSKAEYYRNKIDNRIADFIIQMGKVATLHQVTTMERVVDLLNDAENKGPEMRGQIIISKRCSPKVT
ncbi:1459_t:CDS:2 [Funneliformis mosseae]|uniref:1459_t:CDS:1 n=1 Tax=Funneliformis mosseae TaxID=27381 RepID=A0A9N9DIG7_FUNMO|nr:1459_t:CDS:2 [Funneliformis mosseae]